MHHGLAAGQRDSGAAGGVGIARGVAQGGGVAGHAFAGIVSPGPHVAIQVGFGEDVVLGVVGERARLGYAAEGRVADADGVAGGIVGERPHPGERIGDAGDAAASIVGKGERAAIRRGHRGDLVAGVAVLIAGVAVDGGGVADAVLLGRDPARRVDEFPLALIGESEGEGAVGVLDEAVLPPGGRIERAADLGVGYQEAIRHAQNGRGTGGVGDLDVVALWLQP